MALIISNKEIVLENGISLNSGYIRTNASLSLDGNKVYTYPEIWLNKISYTERKKPLMLRFYIDYNFDYNREVDGSDLLTFANNKVKEELEALGFTVVVLDL